MTDAALSHAIRRLAEGASLSFDEAAEAFGALMQGTASPVATTALLFGLRARGETADEIAGAAAALRLVMVRLPVDDPSALVDTCGTGGGRVTTLNISTGAAFIVAGAGIPVAKHGNRSYTSRSGSADVLEAMGIDIALAPDAAAGVLAEAGLVFLFAPTYHPAMRHVGPTRRELSVPTIMNLLGPLVNPAGARRQVIGVADAGRAALVADALVLLDATHTIVVHAEIGMDEVSPAGRTLAWEVRNGAVQPWTIDPDDYGLGFSDVGPLAGGDPPENAARITAVLRGGGAPEERAALLLNAAAAIHVSAGGGNFALAVERARESLAEGRAADVLERLRRAAPRP